jgi:hypothetical protein
MKAVAMLLLLLLLQVLLLQGTNELQQHVHRKACCFNRVNGALYYARRSSNRLKSFASNTVPTNV